MKVSIQAGKTSESINVFISDSSSTTGAGLTGLAYNTASLVAYYSFTGANATSVSITLATLATITTAWASGGFKEIDATNMPGWYRLDLPNAVLASSKGRVVSLILKGATNMAPCPVEIELTGWDNQSSVIDSNVTKFGGTNGTFSSGRPEVNTTHVAGTSQTARDLGASVLISSGTGTGQLSVSSGVIQSDIAKCGGSTVAAGAIPNVAAGSTGGLILIGTVTRDINPNAGGVVITATGMDDVAAHVWDLAYASHNTAGTFGYQVQNIATGTPPTAAAIASQVRTELTTELGRIDVATSTRLAPTTAGRTLDVSTTGEAGLDFDNIKDATGAHTLTNITIPNVTTAVNVTNNNDKSGYTLIQAFPSNFADLAITSSTGEVTVGTLANNVITTASINDGAITDAKFTVPTPASGLATGILGMVQQVWRRAFKKTTFDSSTGLLKTYANDGTTVYTTETCTEVSNTQTKGAAS